METIDRTPVVPVPPTSSTGSDRASVARLGIAMAGRMAAILFLGVGLHLAGQNLVWANLGIIGIDILTLVMLHYFMKAEGRSLMDLYRPVRLVDIAWGLLAFVIITIGFFVAMFIGNLIAYQGPPPASTVIPSIPAWVAWTCVIVMPLTIALAEEGLYRGYLQPRLGARIGTAGAVIVAAIVFGLQHAGFAYPDPQAILAKVITTLLAGLILGGLMLWFKRTAPLVIAHWLLDLIFLGLPMLYFIA